MSLLPQPGLVWVLETQQAQLGCCDSDTIGRTVFFLDTSRPMFGPADHFIVPLLWRAAPIRPPRIHPAILPKKPTDPAKEKDQRPGLRIDLPIHGPPKEERGHEEETGDRGAIIIDPEEDTIPTIYHDKE